MHATCNNPRTSAGIALTGAAYHLSCWIYGTTSQQPFEFLAIKYLCVLKCHPPSPDLLCSTGCIASPAPSVLASRGTPEEPSVLHTCRQVLQATGAACRSVLASCIYYNNSVHASSLHLYNALGSLECRIIVHPPSSISWLLLMQYLHSYNKQYKCRHAGIEHKYRHYSAHACLPASVKSNKAATEARHCQGNRASLASTQPCLGPPIRVGQGS